jgi:RimJ/RimL family protein N-acetyltransferase
MAEPRWPAAAELTSERLVLEPLRVEHAAEMVAVLADPALYEFIGGEPPSQAELRARYRRQARGESPDGVEGWLNWVLRLRSDRTALGTVQATLRDDAAELAWVVSTSFQGAGYATEGTSAVIAWLRGKGIMWFEAHIHPDHAASSAVARRLGFEPTALARDGEVRWELRLRCHN